MGNARRVMMRMTEGERKPNQSGCWSVESASGIVNEIQLGRMERDGSECFFSFIWFDDDDNDGDDAR